MRTEPSERWVRGFVGDVVVVDSRAPLLFWEEGFPVPRYAFDRRDVAEDLLVPASGTPPREPRFFLPWSPVAAWYDLVVGDRRRPHAAWSYDDPDLAGRVVLSWQPGLVDRWLEEDEEVAGHPRDPHSRVDALPSHRHVVVAHQGTVLADSTRPVLVFETGLPTRFYLPAEDVRWELLSPSPTRSHCPYKGHADRYWDLAGVPGATSIAWSYSDPYPAVGRIAGRVAFYDELLDVTVDDRPRPRPASPFTDAGNRPGS